MNLKVPPCHKKYTLSSWSLWVHPYPTRKKDKKDTVGDREKTYRSLYLAFLESGATGQDISLPLVYTRIRMVI